MIFFSTAVFPTAAPPEISTTFFLSLIHICTMLISSLIIFPALSAMRIFRQFRSVVIASAVISIICFFIGLVASYAFSTPTGASIVIVNLIVFLLCFAAEMCIRDSHWTDANL